LKHIGLKRSISDKSVFVWKQPRSELFLALVTDDCLVLYDNRAQFLDLKASMEALFKITLQEGALILFLNLRIIQPPTGIHIDQTDHIVETIIVPYYKDQDTLSLLSITSPFSTDSYFEQWLYKSPVLAGSALKDMARQHGSSLYHWNGVLLHLAITTGVDINYTIMGIAGYLTDPNAVIFVGLAHAIQYLYHFQHILIVYPRKPRNKKSLALHCGKGTSKFLPPEYGSVLVRTADVDYARDIRDICLVTSYIHLFNCVIVTLKCKNKSIIILHSTGSDITYLTSGVKKTIHLHDFMSSAGYPVGSATPTFE
jgi:hypothetical protein